MKNLIRKLTSIMLVLTALTGVISCSAESELKLIPMETKKSTYVCPKCNKVYNTAKKAEDCCGPELIEKSTYVCPKCNKVYDTAEKARNCCGVEEIEKKVYVCPKCNRVYNTAEKAAECCGPEEVEKKVYVCPKCNKEYDTAEKAAECCGPEEIEKSLYVCPRCNKVYDTAEEAIECCGPEQIEKPVYTSVVPEGTYTVYHVQQKLPGGNAIADYVLQDTEENKNIAKNSTVDTLKKTYTGFTARSMLNNGNVLYIFYDRNTITYTIKTGAEGKFIDGTTERVVKGLYGASITVPIATSATHNFKGWFTSTNQALPSVFGENDLEFNVKWTEIVEGEFNWYETPVDISGGVITTSSEYIYFGVFPKTVIPLNNSIVDDKCESKTIGGNTYYKGNDKNWYAKVSAKPYGSSYTYSDNSKVVENEVRYFLVEPIKWKVITTDYKGKVLLVAEDILTGSVPYYINDYDNRTIGEKTVYPNNYKYSTIRAYLNGRYEADDTQSKTEYAGKGLLQTAFTEIAQNLIADTEVDNSLATIAQIANLYIYICENTTDKLFLLSVSEVKNSAYGFTNDDKRIRKPTDYAKANYASTMDGHGGWWRLRSPYFYDSSAYLVNYSGDASSNYVNRTDYGVVPALSISF